MKSRLAVSFGLVTAAVLFGVISQSGPARAQAPGVQGPFVGPKVSGISFDGDVRNLTPVEPGQPRYIPRPRRAPEQAIVPAQPTGKQRAPQTMQGMTRMPSTLQNFKGLDFQNWGGGWPPDTNGDVGPHHYIQTVNMSIGIFDKTGNALARFTYNTFFSAAPASGTLCDHYNMGDVIVVYDPMADRWIISDFAWSNSAGPFYECIAVSKTGDPVSGGWWKYAMLGDKKLFPDYPKWGVWGDGYYMSANMFPIAGAPHVRVWAFNRADLTSGTLNPVHFDLPSAYSSLLPSNYRGTPPPSGSPNYFASASTSGTLSLWKFQANWNNPSPPSFTGPTNLTVGTWTANSNIPQLNGNGLDPLDDRLMMQNQYRTLRGIESLWMVRTVNSNGYASPRWYEVRDPNGTPTVYQEGTFQPDQNHRWMGSLAVDQKGNMAVGYSVSSETMHPAIRYAGRLVGDPLNALTQAESSLIEGTGSQSGNCGNQVCNRWGDYTAMTVDPVDDCTFWYTNEYLETTGLNWQTRIGSFKFPGCPFYANYLPLIISGN